MKALITNKYLWIIFIILGLQIPLSMIESQISERTYQREVAKSSVRDSWTGEQTVFAGVLVIPYEEKQTLERVSRNTILNETKWVQRRKFVLADNLKISSKLSNQSLAKGIYQVPVYTSDINIEATYSLDEYQQLKSKANVRFKEKPFVSVGIKDSRGLIGVPEIKINDQPKDVKPGTQFDFYPSGFNAQVDLDSASNQLINLRGALRINGMQNLSFITAAKNSEVIAESDWPHPNFNGAFLPVSRKIDKNGYDANWKNSLFSSNIASALTHCFEKSCQSLQGNRFGVSHIQPVDVYQQSLRSVKYGLLIILVTFSIFVLYELLAKNIEIHPVSYMLTGAALAIFFLLLIALSEHIAFFLSYWLASLSCSGLIGYYVANQSNSRNYGVYLFAILCSLYTVLFFIIRSEDHALLSGSILLFMLLALIMFVTRKLDWYQVMNNKEKLQKESNEIEADAVINS